MKIAALPLALMLAGALSACAAASDEGEASSEAVSHATAEHYPIVLAHGFFGFKDFAGIGFINYFDGVVQRLNADGETQVFTPTVDPFNDSTFRGEELLSRIEDIIKQTGAKKVNIVAHSQGGLDARYVAHKRPDLVASIVTVATPHHGSPLSDDLEFLDHPWSDWFFDETVKILGAPLWDEIGHDTSIVKSLKQFSKGDIADFNAANTDQPGIPIWSIAGRSAGSLQIDDCKADNSPPWIAQWQTTTDSTDLLMKVPELVIAGFSGTPNDGLVPVASAHWGTFLGCVPADHLDEIGQPLGVNPGSPWNHLDFYSDIVKFVRAQGL